MRRGAVLGGLVLAAALIAAAVVFSGLRITGGDEVAGALVHVTPEPVVDDGPRPYRVDVVAEAPIREVVLLADGQEVDRFEPKGDVRAVKQVFRTDAVGTLDAVATLHDGRTIDARSVAAPAAPSADDLAAGLAADQAGQPRPRPGPIGTAVEWEGPGRLQDGILQVDDPSVTRVFGYITDDGVHWHRVPGTAGTSLPLIRGLVDLEGHLPALGGADLEMELWRDDANEVAMLGTMRASPQGSSPQSSQAIAALGLTGRVTLGYLPRPGVRGIEEKVLRSARVPPDADDELWFRWDSDVPGVTHVLWQAFADGPPLGPASPTATGAHRVGIATADDGGRFVFRPWRDEQGGARADDPGGGHVSIAHELLLPTSGTTLTRGGPADTAQPIAGSVFTSRPGYVRSWHVRALAFAGDTYLGKASELVTLHVTPEALRPSPSADARFDVGLVLLPPDPVDPQYQACFRVLGIDEQIRSQRAANDVGDALRYALLDALRTAYGDTLCLDRCYTALSVKPPTGLPDLAQVALGSGMVSWSSNGNCGGGSGNVLDAFGHAVVGAGKAVVKVAGVGYDLAASTYNGAKELAIDVVVELSGCEHIASQATDDDEATSICRAAASTVVNGAMASAGLPPELPDREVLIAGAKGDLKVALVELAAAQGIECDKLAAAAAFVDTQGLTCEQIADRIVEKAADELAAAVRENASSAGMPFPPGVQVIQEPLATAGPAQLRVTVRSEPGSALGQTCDATVMSSLRWDAPGVPFYAELGVRRSTTDVGSPWLVPPGPYTGGFLWRTITLPQPESRSTSATATFALGPPVIAPAQQAFRWEWSLDDTNQPGNVRSQWDVPGEVLLLRPGAEMNVTVVSTCSGVARASAGLGPVPELP